MAMRSLLLVTLVIMVVQRATMAWSGRGTGSTDQLVFGTRQEEGSEIYRGKSKGGSTPWKLISSGRPVTVDPPTATCGSISDQGRNLLNLSLPYLAHLRQALVDPVELLRDPNLKSTQMADTPLQCTTHPRCTQNHVDSIKVASILQLPDQCRGSGGSDPCRVDLTMLGPQCPHRYTVTMWVNANQADSPRVLLETRMMRVLYHPKHKNESTVNQKEFVKIKVASCAEDFNISTEAAVTVVRHPQQQLTWDMLRFGSLDPDKSISGELSNISIYPDDFSGRSKHVKSPLAFPGCICPPSHPIPSLREDYLCYTAGNTSSSSSVLRPTAALPYNQVLVDPQVLVDNLLKPYYWVSTPGVREFRLTIDLPGKIKVGRVRVALVTAAPAGGLFVETEAEGQREIWFVFSNSCPSPSPVPCIIPPSKPTTATAEHPALLDLDTEGFMTMESRTTTKVSLHFMGYPTQLPGKPYTHPPYHVVAEVQLFTVTNPTTDSTRKPKDINLSLDKGINYILWKLKRPILKSKVDQVLKSSQLDGLVKRFGRFKRQVTSDPKVFKIFPPYGPEDGDRVVLYGENFGQPNVTIMIGSLPCECGNNIPALEAFKDVDGCNTDTVAICDVRNGSGVIGQSLTVSLMKKDGTPAISNPNVTFVFRPNPVVQSVDPQTSYVLGGRRVTMIGENLNAGVDPQLILTTVFGGDATILAAQYSPVCDIVNSTTLICTTPHANVPKSYQNRRKRAVPEFPNVYLNDNILDIIIGLSTGGYHQNLSQSLGDGRRMYLAANPTYTEFQNGEFELRFYDSPNPLLTIRGEHMSLAAEKEDYTVTVGDAPCIVTQLFAGSLNCMPPKEEDIPKNGSRNNNGHPRAAIKVRWQNETTPGVVVYLYTKPVNYTPILAGVLSAVSAVFLFLFVFWLWRRHEKYKRLKARLEILDENYTNLVTDESTMMDLLQADLRKKVDSCKLDPVERTREIGSGNFGKVYVGRMSTKSNPKDSHSEEYDVAIKTVKAEGVTLRQLEDFLEEATIMKDFNHKNVLFLLGVFIENDRPFVVLPFMANGDLKGYVSNSQRNFKVFDLLDLLIQVARGMNYVSSKGTVHRDLRACNCMVDSKIVVKVGDFGLARQMEEDYYTVQNQERPLPIKWMAPEALAGSKFSTYSDVWSYGVLMWEVMTRGLRPFADVDNYRVKTHVLRGGRLEKPPYCPDEVYRIMNKCWELKSRRRPLFKDIGQMLAAFMKIQTDDVKEQLMATKEVDEDYVEVMRDRTATNEVNEYTKRPGPIPEYLTVLDESEVAVPTTQGHTTSTEHGNPAFEGSKAHHKYENDAYLRPSGHGSGPIDVPLLPPAENAPAPPAGGEEKPYFVNPPISDEYVSASGHEKLASSEHVPRGLIYTETNKEAEGNPETEREPEKVSDDNEEEDSTEQTKLYPEEEVPKAKDPDYVNQKTSTGEEAKRESVNHVVDIPEDGQKRSGVRDLAAKFGGNAKTSDYANQPTFVKRTPKKKEAEEAKEDDNVVVAVSGVPHRGNEVDGYVTCT